MPWLVWVLAAIVGAVVGIAKLTTIHLPDFISNNLASDINAIYALLGALVLALLSRLL